MFTKSGMRLVCGLICVAAFWLASNWAMANSFADLSRNVKPVDVDVYTSMSAARDSYSKQLQAEKDPVRKEALRRKFIEMESAVSQMNWTSATLAIMKIYPEWQKTTDPEARATLTPELRRLAQRLRASDVLQEIEFGERLAQTEIKIPTKTTTVTLTQVQLLPVKFGRQTGWDRPYVARRIAADRIEVWTASEGWLFDAKGNVIHQAKVPRRDGHGRQWYGAFLPDGRWATTDLWDYDHQLHLFGADGKFIKSIPNAEIVKDSEKPFNPRELVGHGGIDWAISDAAGAGWIVSIGGVGSEHFYVPFSGEPAMIGRGEAYTKAYRRTIGSRGVGPVVPSDDGERWLVRRQGGHGPYVDYPDYRLAKGGIHEDMPWREFDHPVVEGTFHASIFNGTRNMGFWPGSHEAFIVRGKDDWFKGGETWFMDPSGLVAWVNALRFADAKDGKSMLFEAADRRVVTIGPDHQVKKVVRFVWPDGKTAGTEQVYEDLGLGLFKKDQMLYLAKW